MSSVSLSLRQRLALELERIQQNMLIEQHPLKQLFWECTLRCNMHCRHCGSDCKVSSLTPDMPVDDFLKVLDEISLVQDSGDTFIIVSGGEPLMRDDLELCGAEFTKRGFPWGMVSNGLLLTQQRLDSLISSGIRSITISLDGLEKEHSWMRGRTDSFVAACEAIGRISASGLMGDVVTCVNKHNISILDSVKDLLISLGVRDWRLFTVFPAGRAKGDDELQLSGDELKILFEFIRSTRSEGRIHASFGCEGFLGGYEGTVRDHFFSCQAGVSVASVRCDGSISGCLSIRSRYDQGNIYKDKFMDVWNNRFEAFRRQEWRHNGICSDCGMFRYCRGNGMHLRDDEGNLLTCLYRRMLGRE